MTRLTASVIQRFVVSVDRRKATRKPDPKAAARQRRRLQRFKAQSLTARGTLYKRLPAALRREKASWEPGFRASLPLPPA